MSDLGNDVDTNAMVSKDNWAAEQTTGFLLWNLGNIWQREQRRALEPYGITPVQFLLLSGLAAKSADQETVSQTSAIVTVPERSWLWSSTLWKCLR